MACSKRKTLCANFELRLTPKLRRNNLEVIVECHENNVNESLICFFFGFGGMCQNIDALCQLRTTFDTKTKTKWSGKELSGDTKEILRRLAC